MCVFVLHPPWLVLHGAGGSVVHPCADQVRCIEFFSASLSIGQKLATGRSAFSTWWPFTSVVTWFLWADGSFVVLWCKCGKSQRHFWSEWKVSESLRCCWALSKFRIWACFATLALAGIWTLVVCGPSTPLFAEGHFCVGQLWPLPHDLSWDLAFSVRAGHLELATETASHHKHFPICYFLEASFAWGPGKVSDWTGTKAVWGRDIYEMIMSILAILLYFIPHTRHPPLKDMWNHSYRAKLK